jgi:hypothetical protein
LIARKYSTGFVEVFAQAQRKSYMGTQKINEETKMLTTSYEFKIL